VKRGVLSIEGPSPKIDQTIERNKARRPSERNL
jgi:hypothetical protein